MIRKYVLIIVNIAFYLLFGLKGGLFLLGVAVASYGISLLIGNRDPGEASTPRSYVVLLIGIGIVLAQYLYHQSGAYYPVGFSFYSLMAAGYLIDVYQGKIKPVKNFGTFFLCLSFFPLIISGPIEKIQHIQEQIENPVIHTDEDMEMKFFLMILYGLLEKTSIANIAELLVREVFNNYQSHSGLAIVIATIVFGIQLYADFDGYSNIARGTAGLLGIDIIQNFKQPYFSTSVKEFWRRWHISLSTWLKDYVYIPLGGSRCGGIRKNLNVMITFLVSGLWHGVGLNYVVWGLLHGVYQVIEGTGVNAGDNRSNKIPKIERNTDISANTGSTLRSTGLINIFRMIWTFILVDFAWFFFRAASLSDAVGMIKRFGANDVNIGLIEEFTPSGFVDVHLFYMLLGIVTMTLVDVLRYKKTDLYVIYKRSPIVVRWAFLYGIIFWIIVAFLTTSRFKMAGFIYGNF
ncbi:MAG: MBOAT family protein [Lachnospiraceae bacterium]|nr:MBOAT family protein [Lachnospiraceae bacterium]